MLARSSPEPSIANTVQYPHSSSSMASTNDLSMFIPVLLKSVLAVMFVAGGSRTMVTSPSPFRYRHMLSNIIASPHPPESITPACFSTSSSSGVRSTLCMASSAARSTTSARLSSTRSCLTAWEAASADSRMTVSIVPSRGCGTALYASSVAAARDAAKLLPVMVVASCNPTFMPRNSCASINPLLPRAPRSAARAMLSTVPAKFVAGRASSCSSMLRRVKSMLVPVSPSGTGNTFSAFRTLRFASMTVVDALMSPRSVCVA